MMRSIWCSLCKETGCGRSLLAVGRADGAAAAEINRASRRLSAL